MNGALKWLLAAFLIGLAGCSVDAQAPEPHKIYWTHDNPANVAGYNVYCGPASRQYEQNWNVAGGNTMQIYITDLGLSDGEHFCTVTAYNFVGESGYSNEVTFATMGGDLQQSKPAAPGNLRVE